MDELTIRILWPEDKRVPASNTDLTAPMDQARALDDAGIIPLGPQRH